MGFGGNHEKLIFSKIRKKALLDFWYVVYWPMRHHWPKNFGREISGKIPFGPWRAGPKNDVFAHFGGEKSRKSKFFFFYFRNFSSPKMGKNVFFRAFTPRAKRNFARCFPTKIFWSVMPHRSMNNIFEIQDFLLPYRRENSFLVISTQSPV